MNNLFPSVYARKNTLARIEEIKSSEPYNAYIDMIYQTIRESSQRGKLGVEIKIKHKLIENLPIDVVSTLVGLELDAQGYRVNFNTRKKVVTIQVFWGLEEQHNERMGS